MVHPGASDGPDGLGAVFDDLEQQWAGLSLMDRAAASAELGVAAYAEVSLDGRLHASLGRTVRLTCLGGLRVEGVLDRAGADFVVVGAWGVRSGALALAEGLAERAVPAQARPVTARLGFGSVLRRLDEVVFALVDGTRVSGRAGRVGMDFVEVRRGGGCVEMRLDAIAAVRSAR